MLVDIRKRFAIMRYCLRCQLTGDREQLQKQRMFKELTKMRFLMNLHKDEAGQDLIEYALVAALIALGATAAMSTLANSISNAFSTVGSKLASALT